MNIIRKLKKFWCLDFALAASVLAGSAMLLFDLGSALEFFVVFSSPLAIWLALQQVLKWEK